MCNGEWSSSIRTRREKLPPLPKVYGDAFFEDLRRYLPHLKRMRFLGGEPFLAPEHFRIWEMAIEMGATPEVHVTTNGTQYNAKVERILKHFPVSISVSMDGVTPETMESVRRNAEYAQVHENVRRFREYAKERGTWFGLTYCLMPANWHEFGDYLLMADEWDCDVVVNTVLHPPEHSFYAMPSDELATYVEGLRRQGERVLSQLGRNREVWLAEFDRLKHRMENADSSMLDFVPGKLVQLQTKVSEEVRPVAVGDDRQRARDELRSWGGAGTISELVCDKREMVVEIVSPDFVGIETETCVGRPMESLYALLRMRYGGMTAVHRKEHSPFVDRLFAFQSTDLVDRTLRMLTFPAPSESGSVTMAMLVDEPFLAARRRPRFAAGSDGV
jgi:hypothetical protein